jgi:hypothetical protein
VSWKHSKKQRERKQRVNEIKRTMDTPTIRENATNQAHHKMQKENSDGKRCAK